MNRIFKSIALVTVFTLIGQLINFSTQIVVAYLFGADSSMDAFNAAFTLPQYITVAFLGSLGFVFLPVFVDYVSDERIEDAWCVASSTINFTLVIIGIIVLVGMCAPDAVLSLVVPGLPAPTRELAGKLSVILWPSVLANGLIIIFTVIYHSEIKFGWPAFVPIFGSGFGLLITVLMSRTWGIFGFAVGTTAGLFLQVILLAPIIFRSGRYRFSFDWKHLGIQQISRLLFPLVIASVFGKATGVAERYLASSMPVGSISHLNYALRLVSMFSLLLSSGIGAVIFQRMAIDASSGDLRELRRTISTGIRYLWLVVAPVLTIGIVLSLPLVVIVFQRGQFSQTDSILVARLFQVYMLSLAAACIGNVTARGFYVLRDTRTVAWMGGIESILYIIYTTLLARRYGSLGIAFGYVILFNGSLIWQSLILAQKTGRISGKIIIVSVLRTSLAALFGGVTAWGGRQVVSGEWMQVLVGGSVGMMVYIIVLMSLKSSEGRDLAILIAKILSLKGA
jgi:putative peptidoglycan lipid II flippase